MRGPELLAVSSLDDAIDIVGSKISRPLIASYIFADPKSAKYLAQFIRADVSFINHIPASLLGGSSLGGVSKLALLLTILPVGPAAPSGYPVSPTARYRREMIESPSPQFARCHPGSISIEELGNRHSMTATGLATAALQPLKAMSLSKEGDVNFFVQGFRTSLVVYILPLSIVAVGLVGYAARSAYRFAR